MEGNHHLKALGCVTGSSLPQKEPRTWSWTWGPEQMEGAHSKASHNQALSLSCLPRRRTAVMFRLGGLVNPPNLTPTSSFAGSRGPSQIAGTRLGRLRKVNYPGKILVPTISLYSFRSLRGSNWQWGLATRRNYIQNRK